MGNTAFSQNADGSFPTPSYNRWFPSLAPTVPIQSFTIAHRTYFFHVSFKRLSQSGIMSNSAYPLGTKHGAEDMQERELSKVGVLSRRPACKFTTTPAQKLSLCPSFDLIRGSRVNLTKLTKDLWIWSNATLLNYNKKN